MSAASTKVSRAGTPGRRRGQRERERGTSREFAEAGRHSTPTQRGKVAAEAARITVAEQVVEQPEQAEPDDGDEHEQVAPRPATRHRSRAHRLRLAALRRR